MGWKIRKQLTAHLKYVVSNMCLQCFDATGWAAGRASDL